MQNLKLIKMMLIIMILQHVINILPKEILYNFLLFNFELNLILLKIEYQENLIKKKTQM